MKKDLKYYLKIAYPIEINEIPEEEGGGYNASIPLLGRYAFQGDGDTIEESIENLNSIKKYLLSKYLNEKIPIPEPEREEEKEYSGKFLIRVPKELHRFMSIEARRNNTTLNQYVLYLLTRRSFLSGIQEELKDIRIEIRNVFSRFNEIDFKIEQPPKTIPDLKIKQFEKDAYKKSA